MREHLYKAKRVNWRELPKEEWWVEGFYVQLPKISLGATIVAGGDLCVEDVADYIIVNKSKQHSSFSNAYPLEVVECDQYEVDPETVCEYTQMTDKNGRKIFEGDILRFEDCSNYPVVWDSDYCAFGSCWYSDFDHLSKYRSIKIEVVGNIFDNPELLEGGEEE